MNYEKEFKKALKHAEKKRQKQRIYETKHRYDKKKTKLTDGKKYTIFMFANLVVVELFSMYAMIRFQDISALYSLIGIGAAIVGQVVTLASYNHKSLGENTQGGIVYETAMRSLEKEDEPVG